MFVPALACSGADAVSPSGETSTTSADDERGSSEEASTRATESDDDADATTPDDDSTSVDSTSVDSTTDDDNGDEQPIFDVGVETFCSSQDPGIYCTGSTMVECGRDGAEISTQDCAPSSCVPGAGCVTCTDGQYTCAGDKVMICDTAVDPPAWAISEVCDPAAGEGCDLAIGTCAVLVPIGDDVATGAYHQFANFSTGTTAFLGGYDVDSFEDRIFVLNYVNAIDVYEVELQDTDADGELEPNQHPDDPATTGPIEARVLTYVETIPTFGTPTLSSSEIYALDDRLYIGGTAITENVLGVGTSVITTPPAWASWFAQIGYDDVNAVWYASNEGDRRVFQYSAETDAWGLAFAFPPLGGDHMDGLEVVTQPSTGTPYVYVADMTSDFIAQYRIDPDEGWVQENVFGASTPNGAILEGMGWGAMNHFWATGGDTVYELGGGDLAEYTDAE